MKLISKTHDYYDSLFSYSGDSSDVFVRKPHTYQLDRTLNFPRCEITNGGTCYGGIIGFCGKIIPYICADMRHSTPEYIYDVQTFIQKYPQFVDYNKKDQFHWSGDKFSVIKLETWFRECSITAYWHMNSYKYREMDSIVSIFESHNVAYFHITNSIAKPKYGVHTTVELYPSLKNLMFYRVYDINTTYQQIEMYLCNQLVKPDDPYIAHVPDKIKAQSKGFDKFSFRKEKA